VVTNPDGQKLSKQTLAPAVSAHDACKLLIAALAFLGQPVTAAARRAATPAEVLAAAAEYWNVGAIPQCRASHIL